MFKIFCAYLAATAALLFIQTNALLPLGNHGIRPDLILFVVLSAAVSLPAVPGACLVFMIGFMCDALSGSHAGFFISIYLLIFAVIKQLCRIFDFQTLFELCGLLITGLIVKYLLIGFFMFVIYEYQYDYLMRTVFREAVFTLVFYPVVFPLLHKIFTRISAVRPSVSEGT